MIFYEKLEGLCRMTNRSFNRVERELGYPRNALHNYKYNAIPSAIRLMEIAEYFKVSPEYLLGQSEKHEYKSIKQSFIEMSTEQKFEMLDLCIKWVADSKK